MFLEQTPATIEVIEQPGPQERGAKGKIISPLIFESRCSDWEETEVAIESYNIAAISHYIIWLTCL